MQQTEIKNSNCRPACTAPEIFLKTTWKICLSTDKIAKGTITPSSIGSMAISSKWASWSDRLKQYWQTHVATRNSFSIRGNGSISDSLGFPTTFHHRLPRVPVLEVALIYFWPSKLSADFTAVSRVILPAGQRRRGITMPIHSDNLATMVSAKQPVPDICLHIADYS